MDHYFLIQKGACLESVDLKFIKTGSGENTTTKKVVGPFSNNS